MAGKKEVYWCGQAPESCDTCDAPIEGVFFDARTVMGPRAFMCPTCHHLGPGIGRVGLGIGQQFTQQEDGRYLKTAG